MTRDFRRLLLLGLLAVLAIVVGWRILGGLGQRGGVELRGGARTPAGVVASMELEVLRLSDLELETGEFRLGRDPFRFPPARPPRPAQRPEPPKQPPSRPQPAGPRVQAPQRQPPPVDVVYLGRFGPRVEPIAVFSDGNEIYNVRRGDRLKEHFLVDTIGYESADLKFVGFPNVPAQRLAIGGKS